MTTFRAYLEKIDDPAQRQRMEEVLQWVIDRYPQLDRRIAWNQPMFTHQGTFIIAFSRSKAHMAVSPESVPIRHCAQELDQTGYQYTSMIFRIPWDRDVDYELLGKMIEYNLKDKAGYTAFWRK